MRESGVGVMGWIGNILASRGAARPAREMEVLEMLALGPRRQVALVRVGSGRYLVGMGTDAVHAIVRVEDAVGVSA